MILYHGTVAEFNAVNLLYSKRKLDFGVGFYTTSDINQAINLALSNKEEFLQSGEYARAYVYSFKFDKQLENYLKVHRFRDASIEWLDYVVANRSKYTFNQVRTEYDDFDVIVGRIADSDAKKLISKYEARKDFSISAKKNLISLLKIYSYTDQYVFKTDKAITFLNQICSIRRQEVFRNG